MALQSRFGAFVGLIAAASMATTPAFATDMPSGLIVQPTQGSAAFATFDTSTYDGDTDIAEWRRGFRRRRYRRRGVRGGDILAGVLILGGIAAVASAANNNRRRERDVVIVERDRDVERRDDRRDDRRVQRRSTGASGLESAVSQCVDRIEQDIRVDSVDSVDRTGQGWLVTGALFNGSNFLCRIDNDGRIADIEFAGLSSRGASSDSEFGENRFEGATRAEGQLDDSAYLAARGAVTAQPQPQSVERVAERPAEPLVPLTTDSAPAYPGGPVAGEEYPETLAQADADLPN